jgi:hypothetical protein
MTLGLLALAMLGCGGIVDTIKGLTGSDAATTQPSPAPLPPARPAPDALTSRSIVLMGNSAAKIRMYSSVSMDPEGDGRHPQFTGFIKELRPGTRGQLLMSHDFVERTYAVEIEIADKTKGVVDVEDVGMIQRVTRVRSDDTLNVRSGRSHKRTKMAEIGPTSPVFAQATSASHAAGCEGMADGEKWWKVRTMSGIEGYVNCHYLGEF